MIDAETPTAAPPPAQDEPETDPGTETPLSASDAWLAIMDAVPRGPQTDLTRALEQLARAQLREGAARSPEFTDEMIAAYRFMETLGASLMLLERHKQEGVQEVMRILFASRQPPPAPNGAFGP